jgi:hypothetical protein
MTPEELEAFLAEMEPDIRSADRDMREIEMLEKKGVTGAGKLTGEAIPLLHIVTTCEFFLVDHEKLQPRLDALIAAHHEDLVLAASLEKRIATLMDRHATYVSRLYTRNSLFEHDLLIRWTLYLSSSLHGMIQSLARRTILGRWNVKKKSAAGWGLNKLHY